MLKLCRVTKEKVFFLVLVSDFNFDLSEFSAAILEKGLLGLILGTTCCLIQGKWDIKMAFDGLFVFIISTV